MQYGEGRALPPQQESGAENKQSGPEPELQLLPLPVCGHAGCVGRPAVLLSKVL